MCSNLFWWPWSPRCKKTLTSITVQILGLPDCYKDIPGERHFSFSPGNYPTKGEMTSLICKARCSKWDMKYVALTQGDFCFCSNTLPDDSMKSSNATIDCSMVRLYTSDLGCNEFSYYRMIWQTKRFVHVDAKCKPDKNKSPTHLVEGGGGCPPRYPPMDRITDPCENMNFPRTTVIRSFHFS